MQSDFCWRFDFCVDGGQEGFEHAAGGRGVLAVLGVGTGAAEDFFKEDFTDTCGAPISSSVFRFQGDG